MSGMCAQGPKQHRTCFCLSVAFWWTRRDHGLDASEVPSRCVDRPRSRRAPVRTLCCACAAPAPAPKLLAACTPHHAVGACVFAVRASAAHALTRRPVCARPRCVLPGCCPGRAAARAAGGRSVLRRRLSRLNCRACSSSRLTRTAVARLRVQINLRARTMAQRRQPWPGRASTGSATGAAGEHLCVQTRRPQR